MTLSEEQAQADRAMAIARQTFNERRGIEPAPLAPIEPPAQLGEPFEFQPEVAEALEALAKSPNLEPEKKKPGHPKKNLQREPKAPVQ